MLNRFSRFKMCSARVGNNGRLSLSDREPYGYRNFADNHRHTVIEGDHLWGLAGIHFKSEGIERPAKFWWAIADYQPALSIGALEAGSNHPPIFDPTRRLQAGLILHIPSLRTLFEEILNESRREEFE